MNEELKRSAESLISQAEQAVDRGSNGLWDREDCIILLDQFRHLLHAVLADQDRLESDRGELIRRLQRTFVPPGEADAVCNVPARMTDDFVMVARGSIGK